MNYGKAIRTARSIADRSQADVAKAASINRSYLSSIESGRRLPSITTLENITKALNIPMHLLRLLGLERGDVAPSQEEQIKSLGVELTKLLLQERTDEDREGNSASSDDAKSASHKKLAGSRA
jgi:transcriptional regulator with XRE-family HTH domain